jgi:lipopolysaccharide export system protein LptC
MAIALTETADQRRQIYRQFTRRNQVVSVLRFLVPGIGVAVFAVLAGAVMIANLAENFSIGRITLKDDRMVVETPSYSGVTSDGSTYSVTALSAEAGLNAMDAMILNGATVVLNGADGVETTAQAARADLDITAETVKVQHVTTLATSTGMRGSLTGMDLDFGKQSVTASGAVTFTFPGGERLDAAGMDYDGVARTWRFTGVTLTLPGTPQALAR